MPDAVDPAASTTYVFGFAEPDSAGASSANGARPRSGAVTIDVDGRPIVLPPDGDELRAIAGSAYALGGTELLDAIAMQISEQRWRSSGRSNTMLPLHPRTGFALQAPMNLLKHDPVAELDDMFQTARWRLWDDIREDLLEVEQAARVEIQARLNRSREQIRAEAETYLLFADIGKVFADPQRLQFPEDTLVRSGTAKEKLIAFLSEVTHMQDEAEAVLQELASFAQRAGTGWSWEEFQRHGEIYDSFRRRYADVLERRSRLVKDKTDQSPLLHWLLEPELLVRMQASGWDADELLVSYVRRELVRAWRSAWVVEQRIKMQPASSLGSSAAPLSAVLGEKLRAEDGRGPWGYPLIIAEALEDLGLAQPSTAATATREAFAAAGGDLADGLVEAAGMTGALVALHAVAPHLAVAVDLVLAAWGIAEALSEEDRQLEDYRATLNPADAIARPPSGLPVLIAIIQAVPFTRWYVQGGAAALPLLLSEEGD
jgi:hypothetical protein